MESEKEQYNEKIKYSKFEEISWFSWNEDPYEFIINNAWLPKDHKDFLKNSDPKYVNKDDK